MKELHERAIGRHFATKITQKKTLDAKYQGSTMFKNITKFCKSCGACQHTGGLAT